MTDDSQGKATVNIKRRTRYNKLNDKQLSILKQLVKFRFVTAPLLAEYRRTDKDSLNKNLKTLLEQEYIARKYDKSYRFDRKAARYYLAPKGMKLLRDSGVRKTLRLNALYKNKTASEEFIEHCLDTIKTLLALRDEALKNFIICCRTEILGNEDFEGIMPDMYVMREKRLSKKANEYFIELWHDIPLFIIKRKFKAYIKHFDDGVWPTDEYPTLLVVLADPRAEKRFHRLAQNAYDSEYIDELKLYTTNYISVLAKKPIWTFVDPDEDE